MEVGGNVSEKREWEMWKCNEKLKFVQLPFPVFGYNVKV